MGKTLIPESEHVPESEHGRSQSVQLHRWDDGVGEEGSGDRAIPAPHHYPKKP